MRNGSVRSTFLLLSLAVVGVASTALAASQTIYTSPVWLTDGTLIDQVTSGASPLYLTPCTQSGMAVAAGESKVFTAHPRDGQRVEWWSYGDSGATWQKPNTSYYTNGFANVIRTHANTFTYVGGTYATRQTRMGVGCKFEYFPFTVELYAGRESGAGHKTMAGTHIYTDTFSLEPNPFARTGYSFTGWEDAAGRTFAETATVSGSTLGITNNTSVSLYAQWEPNSYVVHFDANGGTGTMSDQSMTYDASATALRACTFKQTLRVSLVANGGTVTPTTLDRNSTFVGWATTATGAKQYADKEAVRNLTDKGSITLHAKWQPGSVTLPEPVKANAEFLGWYTAATGGELVGRAGGTFTPSVSTNLYAHWQDGHAVTFVYVIGSKETNDVRLVRHGGTVSPVPDGNRRTGYTFQGWTGSYSSVTEDRTVVARYQANAYSVRFMANGGTGRMYDQQLTYDAPKVALSPNAYTQEHEVRFDANGGTVTPAKESVASTFAGWATTEAGSVMYGDQEPVRNLAPSGTFVLYAKWQAGSLTLPLPNKENAEFLGWYTAASGGQLVGQAGETFTPSSATNLYAQWRNGHKVTFVYGIGTKMTNDVRSVLHGGTVSPVPDATGRYGYTFVSWDGSYANVTEDRTVTARYEANAYTVSFDGNGGAGSMADQAFVYDAPAKALSANSFVRSYTVTLDANGGTVSPSTGTAVSSFAGWATSAAGPVKYADGASVSNLTGSGTFPLYAKWTAGSWTLPQPTKANAEFSGWYTAKDGGLRVGGAGDTFTPSVSTNLYAQWQNGHTVTFVYMIGTKSTNDVRTVLHGKTVSPVPDADRRLGYSFLRWDGSYSNVTEDRTVVAQYNENSYSVHFDANGGSGWMYDQAFYYATQQALTKNLYTRRGYDFLGWARDPAATTAEFEDKEQVVSLTPENGGTLTLFAIWRAHGYTVSFAPNGGTGTMEPLSLLFDEFVSLPPNAFANEPHAFSHWSYGTTNFTDGATVGNLTAEDGGAVVLTAVWTYRYYIAFDPNGGVGEVVVQQADRDTSVALAPNTFTRDGSVFIGWATNDTAGVRYADGAIVRNLAPVNETNTLYAVWSNKSYRVEYSANGGLGEMPGETFRCNEPQTLAANAFVRENCTFRGWARDPFASEPDYGDAAEVTNLTLEADATVRLYALWALPTPGDPTPLATALDCPTLGFTTFDGTVYTIVSNAVDAAPGATGPGAQQYVRMPIKGGQSGRGGKVSGVKLILPAGKGTLTFYYRTRFYGNTGSKFNDNQYLFKYGNNKESVDLSETTAPEWRQMTYEKTSETPEEVSWGLTILGQTGDYEDDFADLDCISWVSDSPSVKTVAVTFRLNDGTPAPADIWANLTVSSGVAYTAWPLDPASAGRQFVGWFTASEGGSEVTEDGVAPTVDTAYYAHWNASFPVPGPADKVEALAVTVSGGAIGVSFAANPDFAYYLQATDALVPADWQRILGPTNAAGTVVFEMPVDSAHPQRFFKIETVQRTE